MSSDIRVFTAFIALLFGIFSIYGTAKGKWQRILNPPEDRLFNGNAFVKRTFGENVLRKFNYIIGGISILYGAITLYDYIVNGW